MMREVETVSWLQLVGNKFNKALHPAMSTPEGYLKQSRTRVINTPAKTIYNVLYDQEYLSEYIFNFICKPLLVLGKEKVLSLVENSWDSYYGENAVVLPSKRASLEN